MSKTEFKTFITEKMRVSLSSFRKDYDGLLDELDQAIEDFSKEIANDGNDDDWDKNYEAAKKMIKKEISNSISK